jgi:hypothetical protein
MARRAASMSVKAEWGGRGRMSMRGENGGRFSTAHPRVEIRLTNPRGVAAKGGHRRRGATPP